MPQTEDRHAVAAATLAAGLLIAQQVAARTARDALFLTSFRVGLLPFVMMASAVLAFLGAEAVSIALARRSPFRVMPAAAGLSAVLLVLEWGLTLVSPRAAAVVVYLHVATFGGALVSGFWSLVNERFDPYTARQVVGRIGTGAAAGGVAGGLLAWVAAQAIPVSTTLPLLGAMHALAAGALLRLGGRPRGVEPQERAPALAIPLLVRMPYLRDLALVVAMGAVVDAFLDFLFKAKAVERFGAGGELMAVFALFHVGMSLLGVLLQWRLARAALHNLGLAGTVSLRPALTAAAALVGAAAPRFVTATLARGTHESLTNSLFRSGYELFYTPLPPGEKRRVKAVVDVAVDKAGTLLGSAVVAVVLALAPVRAEAALFSLAAAVSLGALAQSRRLHLGYVRTLEQSLLAGRVRLDPAEVMDRTTQLTLAHTGLIERNALLKQIEALRAGPSTATPAGEAVALAPSPGSPPDAMLQDLAALRSGHSEGIRSVLRANPEPAPVIVAGLVPLLARDELYPDVVRTLRRAAPQVTGQLVDALLDSRVDPVVRRRIPRVLRTCTTPRSADGLLAVLDDPVFGVRASACAALVHLHERSAVVSVSRETVLGHVRRELRDQPSSERHLAHVFSLLALTVEPEPLRIAWAALRGDDRALRGTALEYLSTVLPEDIFVPLRKHYGEAEAPVGPRRAPEQVAEELRVSSVGLRLDRPPWRRG